MAQTFLSLPNGGTPVAVPVSEDTKTFYAGGKFEAEQVVLEISSDGTIFTIAAFLDLSSHEPLTVVFSAPYARVRIVGLVTGGVPVCILGVNSITGIHASATFVPPPSPGVGAAVALNTLPRVKTFFVIAQGQSENVEAILEVSLDGSNFNPLFKISGLLFRKGDAVVTDGFYQSGRVRVLTGLGVGLTVAAMADPACC